MLQLAALGWPEVRLPLACAIRYQSNVYSPSAPKIPFNGSIGRDYARYFSSELPLQRRPPRHELESETIVDHGEPTRRERDALAIDAGNVLAFGGGAMREAGFGREFCGGLVQLPPPQRVEQIAREDDALALPPRQPSSTR